MALSLTMETMVENQPIICAEDGAEDVHSAAAIVDIAGFAGFAVKLPQGGDQVRICACRSACSCHTPFSLYLANTCRYANSHDMAKS